MRHAGRSVSRSRIAEAVWNYQFDPETNVVDVYVNYLRKKLSFGGRSAPIRTVRGVGYRLEAEANEGAPPESGTHAPLQSRRVGHAGGVCGGRRAALRRGPPDGGAKVTR